jgi:hypothetical protein
MHCPADLPLELRESPIPVNVSNAAYAATRTFPSFVLSLRDFLDLPGWCLPDLTDVSTI